MLLLLAVPQLAGTLQPQPRNAEQLAAEGLKRFEVERGHIEFKLEGIFTGRELLYFDDYGWHEARWKEGSNTQFGAPREEKRMDMIDGEFAVNADLIQAKGTKTSSRRNTRLLSEHGSKSMAELQPQLLAAAGATVVGKETVLGKKCTVYVQESTGTKIWLWNGLTLKSQTGVGEQMLTTEAVNIDLELEMEEAFFSLPKYVRVMDLGPLPER